MMSREQSDGSETQKPGHQRFNSLDQALTAKRIPLDNWPLLQRVVSKIGISGYELTTAYIKAIRDDGGPDLHIYYGYTGGFMSEEEIHEVAGDIDRWLFEPRNLWSIAHPLIDPRRRGTDQHSRTSKPTPVCPNCFLAVPVTGACDSCGWEATPRG